MSVAQLIQMLGMNRQSGSLCLDLCHGFIVAVFYSIKNSIKSGIKQSYKAPIPVMVIGNITVGGSGKTPLLIHLVSYLNSLEHECWCDQSWLWW